VPLFIEGIAINKIEIFCNFVSGKLFVPHWTYLDLDSDDEEKSIQEDELYVTQ
jgi:hypothetical protein